MSSESTCYDMYDTLSFDIHLMKSQHFHSHPILIYVTLQFHQFLNNEVLNSINNFKIDSEKNEKSDEIANIDALSWNQAINEFEGETRNRSLYAKLFAETQGDESKVKARYIEIRAKEIQASKTPDVPSSLSTSD